MTASPAMGELPIIMAGESVRAILDGRKTQTRRVVKYAPHVRGEGAVGLTWRQRMDETLKLPGGHSAAAYLVGPEYRGQHLFCNLIGDIGYAEIHCPHGQPGDRLWVRESFYCDHYQFPDAPVDEMKPLLYYRAESGIEGRGRRGDNCWTGFSGETARVPWRSPIHMPRWASRLALEITEVRVQRLQEITEADAEAEGFTADSIVDVPMSLGTPLLGARYNGPAGSARNAFQVTWQKLNAKRAPWDGNPWVWAITFKVAA